MPFNFDPPTIDAIGRLAECFDKHPVGAALVTLFVVAVIVAGGVSIAIAWRSARRRRTGSQMP